MPPIHAKTGRQQVSGAIGLAVLSAVAIEVTRRAVVLSMEAGDAAVASAAELVVQG